MNAQKYFFIGFNKTATSAIHYKLLREGIKSYHHGIPHDLDKYQAFSDGEHVGKVQNYYNKSPDGLFILNTRNLEDWLISRLKHGQFTKQSWAWPIDLNRVVRWIKIREKHFLDVMHFFKDKPNQFIILNVSSKNWMVFMSDALLLNFKNKDNLVMNEIKIKDEGVMKTIRDVVKEAFKIVKYTTKQQQHNPFIHNQDMGNIIKLFRNNLI